MASQAWAAPNLIVEQTLREAQPRTKTKKEYIKNNLISPVQCLSSLRHAQNIYDMCAYDKIQAEY